LAITAHLYATASTTSSSANDLTRIKDGKQWYVAKDVLDRLIGVEE
jgi:hypothetical protein